jgi:PAS domain S-box-containing protein
MTLRTKTLLIAGAMILCLVTAVGVISYRTVLEAFSRLEEKIMRQEVREVLNALEDRQSNLENTAADYATWDDTYDFMGDANAAYVTDNMADGTLVNLRINIFVFVKPSGDILHAKGVDLNSGTDAPVPADLLARLRSDQALLRKLNEQDSVMGLLRTSKGPMLVAGRAILTSEGEGPRRGTLLVGRYLDAAEISQITYVTGMPLDIYPLDHLPARADADVLRSLQQGAEMVVQPADELATAGYVLLDDVAGESAFMLRVHDVRVVYQEGQATLRYFLTLLGFAILIYGVFTLIFLERAVLNRLARLSASVVQIGNRGDFAARIKERQSDELGMLAGAINRMLAALDDAHQALNQSERRYRSLIENSTDGIIVTDQAHQITYRSPAVGRIFGYALGEIFTQDYTQLFHPDERQRFTELLEHVSQHPGVTFPAEFQLRHRDGTWRYFEGAVTNRLDDPGIAGIVINFRDITGRKHGEQALRRYQLLSEYTREIVLFIQAQSGRILEANAAAVAAYGYTREALLGMNVYDLRAPHARAAIVGQMEHAEAGGALFETVHLRKDGSSFPVEVSSIGATIEDSRVLLSVVRDITERKRAEEQIQHQLDILTTLYAGAQNLAQSLDSLELAKDVARTCVETFGLRLAWVGRAEPDGQVSVLAQFPAECSYPSRITVRWDDTPQGRGPTGRAIQTNTPITIADLLSSPDTSPWQAMMQQNNLHSSVSLPLISRQHAFGALMFYSEQTGYFTPERVQFLQSYALLAAAALENARLFEETERRLRHMQALHKIDTAIASSLDLHTTLNVILEQTTAQLGVDAASILLYDPLERMLVYMAGRGFHTALIQEGHVPLGVKYAGLAALECRTIVSDRWQATGDTGFSPKYLALVDGEGFAAHVVTPLLAKGQIVGVLEVFHRAPLNANAEWLSFLETLAGQAAISIDGATVFEGLQRSHAELEEAYNSTLEGWSRAMDLRDRDTEGHTLRVTAMTERLARAFGMSEAEIINLRRGALLHDIGKLGVPDSILHKPGRLTDQEWEMMRKHPQYAYDMLMPITYLRPALDIPYCHHEKWDGTGYPRGLKGEQIPLAARVFAVVDVWDALTNDRPYRPAWPANRVREHIHKGAGTHFDPQVVEAFFKLNPGGSGIHQGEHNR